MSCGSWNTLCYRLECIGLSVVGHVAPIFLDGGSGSTQLNCGCAITQLCQSWVREYKTMPIMGYGEYGCIGCGFFHQCSILFFYIKKK